MSGLWSFREPGATTTTTAPTPSAGGERDRWLSRRVVTQVLPTGVEYQRDLVRGAVALPWTTTDTTTVAATSAFPARSAAPCATADDSQSQTIDDEDAASAAVIVERGASGLSPAVADEGDGGASAKTMTATAVCRDEAVEAVQRCWWRSLDVDLRPAISLPSAAQERGVEECVGDETEWDEESVRIAQELLTRVTTTAEAATAVSAPRSRDRETPHIRGVHTTQPLRQVRCSDTTALRKKDLSKPSLSGQQRQQQQQRRLDDGDVSRGSCGQRHDVHLTAAGGHTCFAASAVAGGDEGTGNAAALAPSVFLQRALHPTTAPGSDLPAATTNTTLLSPPPLPLLLRRFFGLWRTYAEERRLQRCTAAYRRHLLDCVRDVLGETTLT